MSSEIVPGGRTPEARRPPAGSRRPVDRPSQAGGSSVVDLVAAALRADTADLDSYHRVLSATVSDMLPVGMVEVDRERSMKDRMAGREGKATSIRIRLGDLTLELVTQARGPGRDRVARGAGRGHKPPGDQRRGVDSAAGPAPRQAGGRERGRPERPREAPRREAPESSEHVMKRRRHGTS